MSDRISLDDPNYYQNQQIVVQNNKAKIVWIILVFLVVGIIIVTFLLSNGKSNKLNGQYSAQTAFSINAIDFFDNGNFVRESYLLGEWSTVGNGTYTLNGSSLTLHCSDGRVWEFYYDSKNDTMMQTGTSDVYVRTI